MLPTEVTFQDAPWAGPGMRIKTIRDYAYTHVCYPRCRKWRCEKYCNEVTLWSKTWRECEKVNPKCGKTCTNDNCECGISVPFQCPSFN